MVSCGMPISAPARAMLSMPDSSWSNPAARLSKVEMCPLTSTTPSDGVMIPASTNRRVLLPAPLGPMTPTDSPRCTMKLALRSAQKRRSPCSRRSMLMKLVRSRVFLVKRRLYWTPRSLTASAIGPVGATRVAGWIVRYVGQVRVCPARFSWIRHGSDDAWDIYSTLANAGSRRLNTSVPSTSRTIEKHNTHNSPGRSRASVVAWCQCLPSTSVTP